MADNYNPGQESVQPTASPNIQSEKARFDPNGSVDRLLQALGSDSTQRELDKFNQQYKETQLKDQQVKFDWYVDQFQKDNVTGGPVSQAQVKQRFPETVPIIAARVAEAIGAQQGKKQFDSVVEEIANNDSLRLDTNARNAFIQQKRAEITAAIPQGNEFYGAGVVSALDKLINQHEINWQSQTAAYHQQVQGDAFSGEAVDALNSADPAKALLDLDAKYAVSSSLNRVERNKQVVDAAIKLGFVNDDLDVFKKVPDRFLNVDSKAMLEKARVQLVERRMTDAKNAFWLKDKQREEELRGAKLQIVKDTADGNTIDPAAYRDNTEAYQFALQMREAPRLDESQSHANMQAYRQGILTQTTIGSAGNVDQLTDRIVTDKSLNPKEKQALITELPKLIEGRNLMRDDLVHQPVVDRLNPRLTALETSPNSAIQVLLQGRNLRSEVMKSYELDIRRSFQAAYEDAKGTWPTGHLKQDLVDKAVDRAEAKLESLTKISALTGTKPAAAAVSAPGSTAPSPAPAPRPSVPSAVKAGALPPGVVKLN